MRPVAGAAKLSGHGVFGGADGGLERVTLCRDAPARGLTAGARDGTEHVQVMCATWRGVYH